VTEGQQRPVTTAPSTTVWERDPHVLWRRIGTRVVLKAPTANELVTLDESGLELWTELEQPVTLQEVADRLGERYGVSPSQVAADLEPLFDDLERLHLIHRRDA
jgi:hypothetical protein